MTNYRFPHKMAPIVFGLLLSGLMSLIVSGVSVGLAVAQIQEFVALWPGAWLSSWVIAFPTVLVVAPLVRRLVSLFTQPAEG